MATRLIRLAPPCTTIVADGQVLFRPLEDHFPNLRAVNHADDTETSVMAAAILAKVERDRLLATIDKTSACLGLHSAKGLSRRRAKRIGGLPGERPFDGTPPALGVGGTAALKAGAPRQTRFAGAALAFLAPPKGSPQKRRPRPRGARPRVPWVPRRQSQEDIR